MPNVTIDFLEVKVEVQGQNRRNILKSSNRNNSAVVTNMFTKFGSPTSAFAPPP